jgi:hypothetical protein
MFARIPPKNIDYNREGDGAQPPVGAHYILDVDGGREAMVAVHADDQIERVPPEAFRSTPAKLLK